MPLRFILASLVFVIIGAGAFIALSVSSFATYDILLGSYDESEPDYYGCDILVVPLHGMLLTYSLGFEEEFMDGIATSDTVREGIRTAAESADIRGVLLDVDSSGGSPVGAEEIERELKALQKPNVSVIRDMGASAAYWSAIGADLVYASKNSNVGSIGVTMSYVENEPMGRYIEIASGKYKDAGNPDRTLTDEEREIFLRDVNLMAENFMQVVADNRGLSLEAVREVADGSTMLGDKAKELGLIDEVGTVQDAQAKLTELIGVEDPEVCTFEG